MTRSMRNSRRGSPGRTASAVAPGSGGRPGPESGSRLDLLCLALAVVAVLVRLPHLGWGLPEIEEEALPMKHALAMWGWENGRLVINPATAGWPALSFYVHLLLQHLHYAIGRLTGAFTNRDDYFVASWLDMGPLLLLARSVAVAATAGIVWCGARLARRLAGPEAALLTGGLLALSPMMVEYAQLVTPDVLVALFSALAVARIVEIERRGATADYVWAGVWIGLGISSKYTPVLLLPAVFVAHTLRAAPRAPGLARRLPAREPWWTVLAAVLVFAVTSPFLLLDLPVLLRDVGHQAVHMTEGHFGAGAVPAPIEYLVGVLPTALGWTGFLLSLAGLVWAAVRVRGPWLVLAACVVPYYAGLGALKTQFPRYMLPLLMPIAVGLGGAVLALRSLAKERPDGVRALTAALAAIALLPAGLATWRYHAEKARPGAAHLANRYFLDDPSRRHAHIAAELLGLSLPTARTLDALPAGLLRRLTQRQRARLAERPIFDMDLIPMYSVQPGMSAFYYDLRHYTDYDYIAVSQAIRDRYRMEPERFATQLRFYGDLDRYGTLAARFGPGQGARPPEILLYHVLPESAAAFERDRGPMALDFAGISAGPLSMDDFMMFVEGVARAAFARGDWAAARHYYRLMWEAAPRSGMAEDQRAALGRMVAELDSRMADADSPRR